MRRERSKFRLERTIADALMKVYCIVVQFYLRLLATLRSTHFIWRSRLCILMAPSMYSSLSRRKSPSSTEERAEMLILAYGSKWSLNNVGQGAATIHQGIGIYWVAIDMYKNGGCILYLLIYWMRFSAHSTSTGRA